MEDLILMELSKIPYFNNYSDEEIQECTKLIKFKDFEIGDILIGNAISGRSNYTHIVVEGEVQLMEYLLIDLDSCNPNNVKHSLIDGVNLSSKKEKRDIINNKTGSHKSLTQSSLMSLNISPTEKFFQQNNLPNSFLPQQKFEQKVSSLIFEQQSDYSEVLHNPQSHFIQICVFRPGAVFNLGENLHHRSLVALSNLKCILIPQYWLFSHDRFHIWAELRRFLNSNIPSTKQIFERFVENRNWRKYRKDVCDDVLSKRRKPIYNSIHNVPPKYRIQHMISDSEYH